ncbi:MAG: betaine-aldehyde dehydrogenase [Gemmatimonadetes bacterium]|nr:MAG: betaine-aldehyde dehydrogenase [Gemmatimonadota bacterium]
MPRRASPRTRRSAWRSSGASDPVRTDLFINNEWRPAASGRRFPVVNPATEEVIAEVALGDAADVDAAVKGARACFESDGWRKLSARQRGRLLAKTADLLEARLDEFARLETAHNGKTLFESKIELGMTVNTLRYYAGWADKIVGDTLPVEGPFFVYTLREPIGVVGAIVPWNFPLNIASWKFAPALAAGCTVVLKPASETPLTALLFAELVQEAGFPAGAFNVVAGGGSTAGAALVRHAAVDKISFTGSTEVGRQIMKMAADTNKRVTLELGGKSPNIVFADADVKAAVRGAQTGIFYGKGEVCAAGSRLLVERSVHDQVVEQLAEGAKKLAIGDPLDKNTRLGALVSKQQRETVLGYIKKGVDEGATLVAGGRPGNHNGKGYFVEATVFDAVQPTMTIAREEIFGPVLAVLSFDGVDEGVSLANQTMYGLAAGIWTKDVQKAHRVARAVRAGTVWINNYNSYDSGAPFGGFKASGFGRDLGREALDGYLETKTVWVGL